MRKSEGQRIQEKEIVNFQFVDLKQNTVPYIAVMRFGAWLLFLRKEKDYVDV